ncbi:MAG: hypothetical protein ACRELB_03060 [Polyangiaceae bacterium]
MGVGPRAQLPGDDGFPRRPQITGDPSCGQENAVNQSGAARYAEATSGLKLTPVACGAPAPVACVQGVCTVVDPGQIGADADATE